MGLLADIYSGSDSLKRKVKGLLADPLGTIEQKIAQFGEDQQTAINNAQDATGFGGNRSVLMSPQQKQQASKALGDYAGSMGLAGMFVGQGSSTWNKAEADKALKMAKSGISPREIWSETGNWKGPDGAWRQEIDDSAAKLRDYQFTPKEALAESYSTLQGQPNKLDRINAMRPYASQSKNQLKDEYKRTGGEIIEAVTAGDKSKVDGLMKGRAGLDDMLSMMRERKYGPASSYLKHGDLGKAYPDVYSMHTRIAPDDLGDALGLYKQGSKHQGEQMMLAKKPTWGDDKSTMLHEMQHAIQQREGWAKGGSPEQFQVMPYEDLVQRSSKLQDAYLRSKSSGGIDPETGLSAGGLTKSIDELSKQINEWKSPNDMYRSLAGEAEARATQARIPLDASARRALFPEDSYDVPMNQLIIRGLLAK